MIPAPPSLSVRADYQLDFAQFVTYQLVVGATSFENLGLILH